MEVRDAICNRRSIRGFKPDPVPRKILEDLLETCRWAPSGSNTQPWEFAVLGGKVMEEIKARLIERSRVEWDSTNLKYRNICPDIPFHGLDLAEPYRQRAVELRLKLDTHQFPAGTKDLDEKRVDFRFKGVCFHGAPNAIILNTDKSLGSAAFLDVGIMAQTIALAALHYELGTCIMLNVVFWPDILREVLGIPQSKLIALGIAIGYPDPNCVLNSFVRSRESLDTLTHWYDC